MAKTTKTTAKPTHNHLDEKRDEQPAYVHTNAEPESVLDPKPTANPIHPMCKLVERVGYVQKDKQNQHFKYKYASDEAISAKFREQFVELGMSVESFKVVDCQTQVHPVSGKMLASVVVEFHFRDRDGNVFGPYQGCGSGIDAGDKHVMKALTGARKYALAQCTLMSWGDDPEADASTDRDADPTTQKPEAGPPKDQPPKMLETFQKTLKSTAERSGLVMMSKTFNDPQNDIYRAYLIKHELPWLGEMKALAEATDQRLSGNDPNAEPAPDQGQADIDDAKHKAEAQAERDAIQNEPTDDGSGSDE